MRKAAIKQEHASGATSIRWLASFINLPHWQESPQQQPPNSHHESNKPDRVKLKDAQSRENRELFPFHRRKNKKGLRDLCAVTPGKRPRNSAQSCSCSQNHPSPELVIWFWNNLFKQKHPWDDKECCGSTYILLCVYIYTQIIAQSFLLCK